MFRINQIIPIADLKKKLSYYVKYISNDPQPLVITLNKGEPLVLVNGGIFDDLVLFKVEHDYENNQDLNRYCESKK